jgi:hypothetical protein
MPILSTLLDGTGVIKNVPSHSTLTFGDSAVSNSSQARLLEALRTTDEDLRERSVRYVLDKAASPVMEGPCTRLKQSCTTMYLDRNVDVSRVSELACKSKRSFKSARTRRNDWTSEA